MGQVGPEPPVCARPCNGVAVHTSGAFEHMLAGQLCTCGGNGLLLLPNPFVKFRLRLDCHTQQHFGVLRPAVLCALSDVNAGVPGVHPHFVCAIGNEVCLAGQLGYPETVVRVRRKQFQESR